MPNQTQVVNVSVSTEKKQKKRRRGKRQPPKRTPVVETQRPLTMSAYNTTSSPNRPYIPMMSYISSPFNNGLVPDTWSIKDISQQTLLNIRKAEQQMLQWQNTQTATIEELKNDVKSVQQAVSHQGSQRPLSAVAEEVRHPITIPVASAGRGLNPSPFVPSAEQYSNIPPAPPSAYNDLESERSGVTSLMGRFRDMNLTGRRTLKLE